MRKTIDLILLIALIGCTSEKELDSDSSDHEPGISNTKANLEVAKRHDLISVEIGTTKDQIIIDQRHLHGKFFQDRAEFYVVERPQLHISDTEVTELTLYFIDGVLCKKKYQLASDISKGLIQAYGGFRFKALNLDNRLISKEEGILKKDESGKIMNPNLSNYQMKWDRDELLLYYKLQSDSTHTTYNLFEELEEYSHLLKEAELNI